MPLFLLVENLKLIETFRNKEGGGRDSMFELLALFFLGFVIGLSGAVIPGPLLAFTIFDTSRKRRVTGHCVIFGHVLWEAVVIFIILFGFGSLMTQYRAFIYVVGGLVLILMGVLMFRSRREGEVEVRNTRIDSSMLGGLFYTAFNPTQPLWWATAGSALLLKGLEVMSFIGVVIVTLGHWLSDFAYYTLMSSMINKHKKYISPRQRLISMLLGVLVALMGVYFVIQALIE